MAKKKETEEVIEPTTEELIEQVEKEAPAKAPPQATKDPEDYTEIELEKIRLKTPMLYADIMKVRRQINRAKKAENAEEIVTGELLDIIEKTDPKRYKKLVDKIAKKTVEELKIKIRSSTQYPGDTVRNWKMVIRAIEKGVWWPTTPKRGPWRPPRQKTAYDKFMQS